LILILFVLSLSLFSSVQALDVTADSGSPQDIQAAVDYIINNDPDQEGTVYVPEGDFLFNPTVDGAVKDYDPIFRYREFGDSNINFIAILRIEEPMKRFIVRNEFIKALKERYDKEGIEISWPIRKIYNIK